MALSATTVWEFRTTATAGNVNGGGFNAALGGTDYSQQNAAQLTQNDGVGVGTTNFGSVAGGFTSLMVGNLLHITASTGLTVGWYEIVAFVDGNNVTLDRTPGTGTVTTFYVGGALSLNSTLDDDVFEVFVAGNIVWFKAGTFTLGETISVASTSATTTANIFILGYNAARGDNPTGSNRPSIAIGALALAFGANWTVKNIILSGTSATIASVGADSLVENCKAINTSTTVSRVAFLGGSGVLVLNSEFVSQNGIALSSTASQAFLGNYIHDSDIGIAMSGVGVLGVNFCLMEGCKTAGINITGATPRINITNCTIFGAVTTPVGIGIRSTNVTAISSRFLNNIIYGCSVGIEIATVQQDSIFEDYNDFNNNTTDRTRIATGAHSVTTNPSFTDVAEIVGATATTSGSVLTQAAGDFSTVTDNVDYLRVVSGTGVTVGTYLITAHSGTTLTVNNALGTSGAGNVVYVVRTGHNLLPTGAI